MIETIRLQTWIDAPVERCFLLSLSVDLHLASTSRTLEHTIDGVTTGLIGEGESVTFRARHLGRWWQHTSRIEALRPCSYFRDVMIAGAFRHFEHDHHFAPMDDGTRMRDELRFVLLWGLLGQLAAKMFVRNYLTELLTERNAVIKRVAESEEWRRYLDGGMEGQTAPPAKGVATERWDGKAMLANSRLDAPPRHG